MDALNIIKDHGIVPVLGLSQAETAPATAAALRAGGLPLLEVTMRAPGALDCLRAIKLADPDMLVGAGTILDVQQADQACQAGADFIVTPGFNPKVVAHCLERGVPVVPGCITPTEIEAGMELGLSTFKFFPAEPMNALAVIPQLCGPYRGIDFIPTAGITLSNLPKYLASDKIAAVGGSFMAPAEMIASHNWSGVTDLCQKAVEASLGFSLAHVGVNCTDRQESLTAAEWFADRFGFPVRAGNRSVFAGEAVECCHANFPGSHGHIAIHTLSPRRAAAYFRSRGIALRDEFRGTDANGALVAAYLAEEICGFAVHILKKG